jgi:hypothetical protein
VRSFVATDLAAPPESVWQRVTTPQGINDISASAPTAASALRVRSPLKVHDPGRARAISAR